MRASADRDDDVLSPSGHRRLPMDLSIALPDKRTPRNKKKTERTFTRPLMIVVCVSSPPPSFYCSRPSVNDYIIEDAGVRRSQLDPSWNSNPRSGRTRRRRKRRASSSGWFAGRPVEFFVSWCVRSAGGETERPVEHKLSFDASVIARIIGSFDLRRASRGENAAGRRTHVTPLSERQAREGRRKLRGAVQNFSEFFCH